MNILICNDDGIFSEGILTLATVLSQNHNVTVVAPESNRSACSHSMSFYKEFSVKELHISDKFKSFSITGTPADCVKFGLYYFNGNFDLIIGGVNIGHNLGTDILYSGTISICIEASINGYKSLALSISVFDNIDCDVLGENCLKIFEKITPLLSKDYVWSVNLPNKKIEELKIAKLGIQKYSDTYTKLDNGNYILTGEPINHELNDENTDVKWFFKECATATPIIIDKTNYEVINCLPKEIKL